MARAFTDREKEIIRSALLEKGKELFAAHGFKKTGINELTRAVGISQGAFYLFFPSKEELYLDILEAEEERIKVMMLAEISSAPLTRRLLKDFFSAGLRIVENDPFIRRVFSDEEHRILMERLPHSRIERHIKRDEDILVPLVGKWQAEGRMRGEKPEIIAGLLRSLFLFTLHRREIGEDVYEETLDLLLDLIVGGLVVREGSK